MKPSYICGFDSEDDGKGHPFLWCFTHREGTYYTQKQYEARQYIANMAQARKAKGERLQCWATNLEYDLCNLFDIDTIREVNLNFGRSALCGATWNGADFRDTIRHIPASVEALGEFVGLAKRESDLFKGSRNRSDFASNLVRCQRDSAITYRAACNFAGSYEALGVRPRMTLASTALNLWKSKYWRREVHRPTDEVWEAARQAYHGGRTQAFSVGEYSNVSALDVASMFPWAMTVAPLPLPWGLFRKVGPNASIIPFGIYNVRISASSALPLLPFRSKHGTIYPHGEWEGWYCGEEILAHLETGGTAEILSGFEFGESCTPFAAYVSTIFELKQAARGFRREMYKLLLNSLYGKFGQQGSRVICIPIEKMLEMKNPPTDWRPWMGLAIFNEEGTPPPWGNNIWPAFITARARVALWRMMLNLKRKRCRVLYCDTDSIFYQSLGRIVRFPTKAANIGEFELRGHYRTMSIVGKKEYALEIAPNEWKPYVKGIPFEKRMEYLRTGNVTFDRPMKIRESSRTGIAPNIWRTVPKVRRTILGKTAGRDGSLPTPVIAGADTNPARKTKHGKGKSRKIAR